MTPAAQWLNEVFGGFDGAIFEFAHTLHKGALGGFLDVFLGLITHLGDAGVFFILVSIVLIIFKKTRKAGIAMAIAIAIGALITNVCVKNIVARARPYADETGLWYMYWTELGSRLESDMSFPSGHTTVAFASMTPFFWYFCKKWSWTGILLAFIIAFSRIYIFVHYPSDVLGGFIVGAVAGLAAIFITQAVYREIARKKRNAADNAA